jgi:hypothetical protein
VISIVDAVGLINTVLRLLAAGLAAFALSLVDDPVIALILES